MGFVLALVNFSGKRILQIALKTAMGKRFCSLPSFHTVPPQRAQPFIRAGLGPLSMRPPASAKLSVIVRRGSRKHSSAKLMSINTQCATCMEI